MANFISLYEARNIATEYKKMFGIDTDLSKAQPGQSLDNLCRDMLNEILQVHDAEREDQAEQQFFKQHPELNP